VSSLRCRGSCYREVGNGMRLGSWSVGNLGSTGWGYSLVSLFFFTGPHGKTTTTSRRQLLLRCLLMLVFMFIMLSLFWYWRYNEYNALRIKDSPFARLSMSYFFQVYWQNCLNLLTTLYHRMFGLEYTISRVNNIQGFRLKYWCRIGKGGC